MTKPKPLVARNIQWLIDQAETNATALSIAIGMKKGGQPIVPQVTIFRILEGESKSPRNSTLQPIADYFGVKLSDLLEWDFAAKGRPQPTNPNALTWDDVLGFMYAHSDAMTGEHMAGIRALVESKEREALLRFQQKGGDFKGK